MSETDSRSRSITLLDESQGGNVFVVPANEDRFLLTVEEAVRACKASDRALRFSKQFEHLLTKKLPEWITTYRGHISSAHLTIRDTDILLVVVQNCVEMNSELVNALTELDISIACDENFDLIKLNVLSLPLVAQEGTSAFLSDGQILNYAE